MFTGYNWIFFVTSGLLGASVVDDLRSRKVHNSLVLSIFAVALTAMMFDQGPASSAQIAASIFAAVLFCLPLYMMRALGGGDFKLMIAISPLMGWGQVGWTLAYSLVWGSILGLVMVIVRGEAKSFVSNLSALASRKPVKREQLHKLPYTIAILLGFLTQMTLEQKGISIL